MNYLKLFAFMALVGLCTGCGLFGANAPTAKDTAKITYNAVVDVLEVIDAKLSSYIETHQLSDDGIDEERIKDCVRRLELAHAALDLAYNNLKVEDEPGPSFKENLGQAAKMLKLTLPDLRALGIKISSGVENALDLAIAYANVD